MKVNFLNENRVFLCDRTGTKDFSPEEWYIILYDVIWEQECAWL